MAEIRYRLELLMGSAIAESSCREDALKQFFEALNCGIDLDDDAMLLEELGATPEDSVRQLYDDAWASGARPKHGVGPRLVP